MCSKFEYVVCVGLDVSTLCLLRPRELFDDIRNVTSARSHLYFNKTKPHSFTYRPNTQTCYIFQHLVSLPLGL